MLKKIFSFNLAGVKKFEYFTPTKTPSEIEDPKEMNKDLNLEMVELFRKDEGSSNKPSPFMDPVHFETCSPRKNRNIKKRHYNVSPDGVSSLDEYATTTITYDTQTPSGRGRRMSITISDGNSSEISSEPILIAESLETSSMITQSTNSRTTASPLPSPSSGLSLATTATCKTHANMDLNVFNEAWNSHTQAGNTLDSKQSQANRPKSLCQKIGEEANGDVISSQENLHVDLNRRRHAINITSNPGYRVSFYPLTSKFFELSIEIKRLYTFPTINCAKSHTAWSFKENWGEFVGWVAYGIENLRFDLNWCKFEIDKIIKL